MSIRLAFSGGGFRATFYALGAYRRLVELGVSSAVSHVSSVSGGSLAAAAIFCALADGTFCDVRDFDERVTQRLRRLGQLNLRRRLFVQSLVPGRWRFQHVKKRLSQLLQEMLDQELCGGLRMRDLPTMPVWSCNATCLHTMQRFDFGSEYRSRYGDLQVSLAVAASNAFPLIFAPIAVPDLHGQREHLLTDGGVYDNLGTDTLFQGKDPYILLDASQDGLPQSPIMEKRRFGGISMRLQEIALSQIGELRRRMLGHQAQGVQLPLYRTWRELVQSVCDTFALHRDLPEYGGDTDELERLIAGIRTDLDAFHDIEIDALMWAGATRMDLAVKSLRPELLPAERWSDVPTFPSHERSRMQEVLHLGQKLRPLRRVHKVLT